MTERSPRILIIRGVHATPELIAAIRTIAHVADVAVVEAEKAVRVLADRLAPSPSSTEKLASMIAEIKGKEVDVRDWDLRRQRDYPTLREGIRRKTIKSLHKGRRP